MVVSVPFIFTQDWIALPCPDHEKPADHKTKKVDPGARVFVARAFVEIRDAHPEP